MAEVHSRKAREANAANQEIEAAKKAYDKKESQLQDEKQAAIAKAIVQHSSNVVAQKANK